MLGKWVRVLVVAGVVGAIAVPVEAAARQTRRPIQVAKASATRRAAVRAPAKRVDPFSGPFRAALLIEADTGRVLFEKNAELAWPPASMVKMMVALLAFEAIRADEIGLDTPVRISATAARTSGSRVYLRPGEIFPLKQLLQAMMVASANDAAIAVAEAVGGSRDAMIGRMNLRARELGMLRTVYRSVNGLPPVRGGKADTTTAGDLAILARKLVEYPELLGYSSLATVPFRKGKVRLRNTNHLVGKVAGVDGLKTGYYRIAGFNLTATANRDGMRLITVVLGCPNLRCRFEATEGLIEWGYANYSKMAVVRAGEPLSVEIQVANGTTAALRPVAAETSTYLVRKDEIGSLEVRFQMPSVVTAPVSKNQPLGEIIIRNSQGVLDVVPAISPSEVGSATDPGFVVSN
jgi:D-alanyl-D-alanine carboxypeptidase (penicillin-binding protein 5/6)